MSACIMEYTVSGSLTEKPKTEEHLINRKAAFLCSVFGFSVNYMFGFHELYRSLELQNLRHAQSAGLCIQHECEIQHVLPMPCAIAECHISHI